MPVSDWPPLTETDSIERTIDAPKGAQGEFAVVAGADGFTDEGASFRLDSGEKQRGFHLGAGDRRGVVDAREARSLNRDGCVAVGEIDVRTHLHQGFADALHGAPGERLVTGEGEAAELCCEQAGEHAHRRSRVAAVQRLGGGNEVTAGACDFNGRAVASDLRAQGGHATEA